MDYEKLLTREQKEGIIRQWLKTAGYDGLVSLRYDRRYGWDFEVKAHGERPIAIFSVSITDPRFKGQVIELARALHDIQTSTSAVMIRGSMKPIEA